MLGRGMRLLDLDPGERMGIEPTPTRVVDTPEVLHVRYRVEGPAALVLDDRGRGVPARTP